MKYLFYIFLFPLAFFFFVKLQQGVQPDYTFAPSLINLPAVVGAQKYSYGEPIVAALNAFPANTLINVFGGNMIQPLPGVDGYCTEGTSMKYFMSEATECNRDVTFDNLRDIGSTFMSLDYMVNNLRFGKFPTAGGNLADQTTFIKPEIRMLSVYNSTTSSTQTYNATSEVHIVENGATYSGDLPAIQTARTLVC